MQVKTLHKPEKWHTRVKPKPKWGIKYRYADMSIAYVQCKSLNSDKEDKIVL